MRFSHLSVRNYRGLRDVSFPLSRFGCLIGKNNSGKSTVLQAISLFFSGTKLNSKDYFDLRSPIRIEIRLEDIGQDDLKRLAPEHKEKIEQIVEDGNLTLVRVYDTSGSSSLQYVALTPKEERFKADNIADLVRGLRAANLLSAVIETFPELDGIFTAQNINHGKVKDEIKKLADALPTYAKELSDSDLPTGIDASIKALLPDPIYIPAVKNLADDIKAKESTPFGKVLNILLDAIEPQLGNVKSFFADLSQKFNRIVEEDGTVSDNRLPEVKKIETTVEKYLRDSFADVTLELNVPPPELKAILSSAELFIDDGVKGSIESKGDGLRRAAVFAILRSYVALNEPGAIGEGQESVVNDRHILLFEEPELYLHPSAQKVLFDTLSVFSKKNHIFITTHSPAFFGPSGTASFIKLIKISDEEISKTPFTEAYPIDLSDVKAKDQFQLICFENNNAAFFFDSVILVEGDSDYIVLPHVASLVTPNWDSIGSSHKFVRINGKGSIKRYKDFFSKFNVRISVITDLDLLTGGFDAIEPDTELQNCRGKLLELIDKEVETNGGFKDAPNKKVLEAQEKTELLGRWKRAKQLWEQVQAKKANVEDLIDTVDSFFAWEKRNQRLQVLQESTKEEIVKSKRELLSMLRDRDIFVLERGALEAYYPDEIEGGDKPTKAQDFCRKILSKEDVLALCDEQSDRSGKTIGKEFEIICLRLFSPSDAQDDI